MIPDERTDDVPAAPAAARARDLLRQRRVQLGAVIALAVAAVLAGWAVSRDDAAPTSAAEQQQAVEQIAPVGLSEDELRARAAGLPHPVYWVGTRPGYVYELTRTADGNVYVRYLPEGVEVGAQGSDFLVVATYPFPDALGALRKVGNGREIDVAGGGIALVSDRNANSVYLAFPDVQYQVEVYDPSPERALELARSGAVRPVG